MYYVLLGIIAILLFILRKRIIGGIVGVVSLVLVIGLTIFLLDFFWLGQNNQGNERDIRNFQPTQEVVGQYDELVEDPVQKAKDLGEGLKDTGVAVNETLQETGSKLDERLGIQKDTSNNNLWTNKEETVPEGEQGQESKNSEEVPTEDEGGFFKNLFNNNSEPEEGGVTETQNTNQETSLLTFDQLNRAETAWGITNEDARFVRSASPFNLGEFSNGSITIEVVKEGVRLK